MVKNGTRKYPIELRYRGKTLSGNAMFFEGLTSEMSTGRILILTDQPVSIGQLVEIAIEWPAMIDNSVHLNLHVKGGVTKQLGQKTLVMIERYEFRTRPTRATNQVQSAA